MYNSAGQCLFHNQHGQIIKINRIEQKLWNVTDKNKINYYFIHLSEC